MKLPLDLDADELVRALVRIGYRQSRQVGSHVRLTLDESPRHHITVPRHSPLRVGTLAALLQAVGERLGDGSGCVAGALVRLNPGHQCPLSGWRPQSL